MLPLRRSAALFVDFDNIQIGRELADNAVNWVNWLEDRRFPNGSETGGRRRRFRSKRIYWNANNDRLANAFRGEGFETFACPSLLKTKKSDADMTIAIDAMEILARDPTVRDFVIITRDSDFIPLFERLRARGRRVYAVGDENAHAVYAAYSRVCDGLIKTADLHAALSYQRPSLWLPKRSPAAKRKRRQADDLDRAAVAVVALLEKNTGSPVGQEAVKRAIAEVVTSFEATGRPSEAFLGYGTYASMARAIAKKRREIRLIEHANGGVALAWKG
ncbi:MAG: NYN domain-containing protein [Pseudomonadota bacterium]